MVDLLPIQQPENIVLYEKKNDCKEKVNDCNLLIVKLILGGRKSTQAIMNLSKLCFNFY